MRDADETSGSLFSYVDLEDRIASRHPLRKIRQIANDALASLDAEFEALYADSGGPSIAPERLIRASMIPLLFSVRSERQLMERMHIPSCSPGLWGRASMTLSGCRRFSPRTATGCQPHTWRAR